jgi:hypothetical protein
VRVRTAPLGLNVHFIDDWRLYHEWGGELHCGTKVRRRPPEIEAGDEWWNNWEALMAVEPADP